MKKIHSFLICFLLAATALFPLSISGGNNLATYAEAENEIKISSKLDLENIAENVNSGTDSYSGKTIVLSSDLSLGSWTPIGNEQYSFEGTFDGAGHTISDIEITEEFTYQGLFGYANGATIKNLCVKDFSSKKLSSKNGVSAGSILGKGSNTTIENCEVDQSSTDGFICDIVYPTKLGSFAGQLDGGVVSHSSSFMKVKATYNLVNEYSISVGGFAGSAENTKFEKVSAFGGVDLKCSSENQTPEISSYFSIGGFVGELSGDKTEMFDCVIGGDIDAQQIVPVEPAVQEINKGAIAGKVISSLKEGQIASIAYTTSLSAFGQDNFGYKVANNNIMQVPTGTIKTQEFYSANTFTFEMNGSSNTFVWYEGTGVWDFVNTWVMANDQLRLQIFQFFDVSFNDFYLDKDGLLERIQVSPAPAQGEEKPYAYNQLISMTFHFKDGDNKRYYEISDILLDGKSLALSEFVESEDVDKGLMKTSKSGDICFYQIDDVYYLDVYANNSTEGKYSFKLEAIKYKSYLMSDENGSVCYSGSSDLRREFSREMSASSNEISIEAVSNKKYKFNGWSIYYEDEEAGEFEHDEKTWKKQDIAISADNPLSIKFSEGAYNQSFILMANFIYDPCTISFTFDSTMIAKVMVNTESVVSSSDSIDLDKSENAKIKVYVKENIDFDSEAFEQTIRKAFKRDSLSLKTNVYKNELDSTQTVYEYSFDTSALNYETSSPFNFTLSTKIIDENEGSNTTLWIILGSVGGGLLLAGIGLTIWLVRRKRAYSKTDSYKNDDFKNYYY